MLRLLVIPVTFAICLATAALAQSGPIQIDHPWARASTGPTGAVYMTIKNTGAADDKLVAAATPVARQAQLHIDIDDNGIMKMRPLKAIEVKANSQATLKPGGMHIMLVGLKRRLKAGESFPLTLTLEHAGKLDVTVVVEKAGAMGDMKM